MPSLCIILAYMLRMDELDASLQEDLEIILSKSTYLIDMMLQVAMQIKMMFQMRNIPKKVNAKTINTLIGFSQNIVQGMWYDDDDFLQLPFLDYEKVRNFKKKSKNITFENFCRLTRDERKALGMYEENIEQFEECEKVIQTFPIIDVNVKYEVEGETDIAVGDFLTIKITVTHLNLEEKQSLGFVHSNKFPYLKKSSWYLVFTDSEDNELLGIDKLIIGEKVHVKEMKDRMTRPGTIELHFHLKNDSYRGFDKKMQVKFNVLKEAKRPIVEYDEEDI
jgi:hypothetical protein